MLPRIRTRVRAALASALAALVAVQVCEQPAARAEDEPTASSLPPLRIESSDPRDKVSLYRVVPVGFGWHRGRRIIVYDRVLECPPPCQFRPETADYFKVDGPGLMSSDPFVLGPDTKAVHISMGSRAETNTGWALYFAGAIGTLILALPAGSCAVHGATEHGCVIWMSAAIGSALMAVGGLMLVAHNRTKVRVSPPD